MKKILIIGFLFVIWKFSIGQNLDTISREYGVWEFYDTDSMLVKQIWHSHGVVDSVLYFDISGERIINIATFEDLLQDHPFFEGLKSIQTKIINEFNWHNVIPGSGEGTAIISFTIEPNLSIKNARVIKGIHHSLNNELIRCTNTLNEFDILCCYNKSKTILIILPISIKY